MKNLSIIFFGNEKLYTGPGEIEPAVLPMLLAKGYKVKALILHKKPDLHKSKILSKIEEIAQKNQLKTIPISSDTDLYNAVKEIKADIGIVIAFGKIIPKSVLNCFPYGIINVHPSLLPKYRGPSPIEQTILDGKTITGVSVIKLTEKMDSGPIYAQSQITIDKDSTKTELAQLLLQLSSTLMEKTLTNISNGKINIIEQTESKATFTHFIKKTDGLIKPRISYEELDRHLRAMSGWPGSYIAWHNLIVFILEVKMADLPPKNELLWQNDKKLYLSCKDASAQVISLKIAGKSKISGIDFINAYNPPKF